ncbi:TetR/AcrR family transcriptional regulator [Brachybacterium muris]|uniref:TetR/AcrR family transcriptional regulator n=1 Tax=Brachybacterium muris TaxID=219301 RepID=UPI00223C2197|nr:TetR/AcrR family transcriptional regulator [Brachybacterium muris]MCT2261827.1 TetR/AcrR family transcriptional regulator [Brachybacterium muris]
MPRISAPSVAEHRAAQERALLDAAHAILEETGEAPTMAQVAARAGLARPSVYQYFSSHKELLQALVKDVFPRWTERIASAMRTAPTPGDRILAYAAANIELVAEGSHAIGTTLASIAPGEDVGEQAEQMHRAVQEPLVATLIELDVPEPADVAELINAMVHGGTRMLDAGQSAPQVIKHLETVLRPMVDAYSRPTR